MSSEMSSERTDPILISVCVGLPSEHEIAGERVETAIFKSPAQGRVHAGRLGLEGDGQADLSVHGGADKAIYAYSYANTLHWRAALERDDLGRGAMGENLTIDDLPEDRVHVGDVFRIGGALVQVTQPREPCFKLAFKLGLPRFPKQFLKSGRVGFYLRVLEEGGIEAGDRLECIESHPAALSIRELNDIMHFDRRNMQATRRALAVDALADAWRRPLAARLESAS
jgi:MOSC domain-containing protein YiiM